MQPTEDEITDEASKAGILASKSANPWPSQTYIEGVRDALDWVQGDADAPPLDELGWPDD